jgi:hypothetical protein
MHSSLSFTATALLLMAGAAVAQFNLENLERTVSDTF